MKLLVGNMAELKKMESDSLLWQAFRDGRSDAFTTIYQKHIRDLYNYGYNLTRKPSLVEDAIQDLFVYLLKHRHTLGPTDNIRFYLFRSLRRLLAKACSQREYASSEEYVFENAVFEMNEIILAFVEEEADALQRKRVMHQIENLPKRQKEAVFLLYVNGLSYQEVATIMELEVKSVYNLINKAIHTLRQKLLLVWAWLLIFFC